jgi:peptidoglycan/xylan/chitin deacetylase (PgdA/CDA1 family)
MASNFLFHRVSPERDALWDPMDVPLFEKCISYISRHYRVMLLEDMVSLPDLAENNDNLATISFDDGYKDNIEYAAPILDKYGCKASFYVVTDCIDQNIPTWTHVLEHSFQYTNRSNINLTFNFLPSYLRVTDLANRDKRLEYVKKLKPFLKTLPHQARNLVLQRVQETYTDIDLPRIMMNWQDLLMLNKIGHYIGSHTVSHSVLGKMTDENEIKRELLLSARTIEKNLGYWPKTISYPVGSYNETTIRLSRDAGYEIGLAVKQRPYYPMKDPVFEIPRIELYNESWFKTKLRISNALETIKKVIRYR